MIEQGEVRAERFVSHRFPLGKARDAYATALDGGESLKIVVLV